MLINVIIPDVTGEVSNIMEGMVAGWWLVVAGWWLVVDGWWLVVGGWWLVVAGGWLLVAGFVLQVDSCKKTIRFFYKNNHNFSKKNT